MRYFTFSRSSSFCFLFFFCSFVMGQTPITIPQSTMQSLMTVGNSIHIYATVSTLDSVNVGQRGGPNIYDFRSLNFGPAKLDTFRLVSTIPYLASRFPGATLTVMVSEKPDAKNHLFFHFENDELTNPGEYEEYSADSLRVSHGNPPELLLKFPITYSDSIRRTSTITDSVFARGGLAKTDANNIPIDYVVDGYGTLLLPGGESRPCLRLRWYEMPPQYHYKAFRYVTDNGMFLYVGTTNDKPDAGMIAIDGPVVLFRNSPLTHVSESTFPVQFMLSQNYPNPFNPSTRFAFQIPSSGLVTLRIFDLLGREVASVLRQDLNAGQHGVQWDAQGISSGVYFYRLQAGSFIETRKLILLR